MKNKNLLVGQSGGPTVAINASLSGVLEMGFQMAEVDKVYGTRNGIQGVLEERICDMEPYKNQLDQLQVTPSMFLGSCRYKLPQVGEGQEVYEKIFEVFSKYRIGYFFYIGGNDSMDTVLKLSSYAEKIGYDISIMGVPKTIDNDLMEIDHTPGFGSAAKYIASSILEMAHDTYIYRMKSVLIVEIMGRNAGWLTASSVLARNEYSDAPHLIYLPEKPFRTSQFIMDVRKELEYRDQVIVAVSEGIRDTEGMYISAQASRVDQFGHVMLSGTGKYLESLVTDAIGCKVRSVELNVLQRCASHIASKTDILEAAQLGREAVKAAVAGQTGCMSRLTRTSNDPYVVEYSMAPIARIANEEKKIPQEWINEAGNDVTDDMVSYLKPLIQGEMPVPYKNGLPKYLYLSQNEKRTEG